MSRRLRRRYVRKMRSMDYYASFRFRVYKRNKERGW